MELLQAKKSGREIEPREEPVPQRVINLMDALRASIGAETRKKPAAASTRKRGTAKRQTRGEAVPRYARVAGLGVGCDAARRCNHIVSRRGTIGKEPR
jgi:hypothetical protein